MTSLLVITLVLEVFILIALFWASKKFFSESKTLRSLLIEQGEALKEKAERLMNSAERMGECTNDIKGLSDWTKDQEARKGATLGTSMGPVGTAVGFVIGLGVGLGGCWYFQYTDAKTAAEHDKIFTEIVAHHLSAA